jgi:tagaturonate reductase
VLQLAGEWKLGQGFADWVAGECVWLNTLVDRIVTMPPKGHPLAADPLAVVGEPFAFFAIQHKPAAGPFVPDHPAIVRAPDITPYFLRKVCILNAAHTALLIKSRPNGVALVREAMADPDLSGWLERLLFEEIVPTLEGRVEGGERFARQTLDRFRNPFLDHKFADIAQHHGEKVQVRLVPTSDEFARRFGRTPPLLDEVLRTG